jgi:hypothetical protein
MIKQNEEKVLLPRYFLFIFLGDRGVGGDLGCGRAVILGSAGRVDMGCARAGGDLGRGRAVVMDAGRG